MPIPIEAAAIMLENVFSHVLWLWHFCRPSIPGYIIICTLNILLLIPMIAGILLSMLQDRHRPVWPVAEKREFTAQQLSFESGYRSYSTFSNAFKHYSGKTVTAWMRDSGE